MGKKNIIIGMTIILIIFFSGWYYFTQKKKVAESILLTDNTNIKEKNIKESEGEIKEISSLGKNWYLNNIQDDGLFVYLYNQKGDITNKNNAIRQLLAFEVIAQLCQQGDKKFCEIHQKNLDFLFKNWYKTENKNNKRVGYIFYKDVSKLGSNALFLRVLLASPYFEQYKESARELVDGIEYLQNEDASFQPFFISNKHLDDREDYLLNFYSGEAILSLMEYYEKTNDEDVYQIAKKAQDYYFDKYIKNIDYNYYPAYVPWHTFSLFRLYQKTKDPKYAQGIFVLNDELIKIQDQNNHRGRFYDPRRPEYGNPHSSSDAVYGESLVTAYVLAKELNDTAHCEKYSLAIKAVLDNLARLQFCNSKNKLEILNKKMCGGLQIRAERHSSRVDSLAHTFDFIFSLQNILN